MKRMKISFLFGLVAILAGNLIAQERKGIDKPGKKIKLVRTYKSEADYVAQNSSRTLRVEESGDKFIFWDEKGFKRAEKQKEKGKVVGSIAFTAEEKENFGQHKGVTKPTVEYEVLGDGAFLMETHQETSFNSENDVSRAEAMERKLYDSTGKKILDFPKWMNVALVAPDKKHFLGYYDGEVYAKYLYFYDASGALLKTLEFTIGDHGWVAQFSPNGRFVILFNNDADGFDVLNPQGDILWSYKAEPKTFCGGYGCVSNSGELVACLSAGYSIIKKGKILFNQKLSNVAHNCEFTNDEQTLMVYVGKRGKRALKLISLNGEELDSLELGNVVKMKGKGADNIIVQSTGGINEYQIE